MSVFWQRGWRGLFPDDASPSAPTTENLPLLLSRAKMTHRHLDNAFGGKRGPIQALRAVISQTILSNDLMQCGYGWEPNWPRLLFYLIAMCHYKEYICPLSGYLTAKDRQGMSRSVPAVHLAKSSTFLQTAMDLTAWVSLALAGASLVAVISWWTAPKRFSLKGKTVLITGASQGM